jgi:hypothetical protein
MLTGSSCRCLDPDGGGSRTWKVNLRSTILFPVSRHFFERSVSPGPQPSLALTVISARREGESMKKTLAVLATMAAVGVTAVAAPSPAEARGRGIGPGLAFGLAAGAITAGAVAASRPHGYYGPRYGYYGGPSYYYGPGPHAYYGGGPYHRHHHWRHW